MNVMLMIGSLYCFSQVLEYFDEGDYDTMKFWLVGLVLSIASIVGDIR